MASLGIGKGTPGAHWKPGGITRQAMGAPAMKLGENPMDFYLKNRNPYSRDSAAAQGVKNSPIPMQSGQYGTEPAVTPTFDIATLRRRMMRQFQ